MHIENMAYLVSVKVVEKKNRSLHRQVGKAVSFNFVHIIYRKDYLANKYLALLSCSDQLLQLYFSLLF